MYSASVIITPPFPLSLSSVIAPWKRGKADPIAQDGVRVAGSNPSSFWTTTTHGSTDILLRFEQQRSEAKTLREKYLAPIEVHLWTEKTPSAISDMESLVEALPRWVGVYDDWTAFEISPQWKELPETLIRSRQEHPGVRLGATGEVFKNTVASITEQRVTGIEAMGGLRSIIRQSAQPAPKTGRADQPQGMYFFPSPNTLASLPSWTWHRAGYDQARSATIVNFAREAESIERIAQNSPVNEFSQALASVSGIGPWTIAEVLQRSHGHPDAISVGDFHLAHHVGWAFERHRADDRRMIELLAPFRGHRNRVVALIKAAGIEEPRRAPRYSPQDHRNH